MNILKSISSIYDAAVDSIHWDIALDECVGFVGARSATIVVVESDPANSTLVGSRSKVFRDLEEVTNYYIENLIHHERDGWEYVMKYPKQTIISDQDVWPDTVSENREDFKYLSDHVNILRKAVARLNDNRAWFDNIAFQFDKKHKSIPANSKRLISQLLPHMAKSIELNRTYSLLQSHYNAVLTALDRVEVEICIAQSDGSVIIANSEANRILSNNDGIALSRVGKLHCKDENANSVIKKAITETSETAAGSNENSGITLSIRRPSGDHSLLIEISPLSDSNAELERNLRGSLITLIDPANHRGFQVSRVAAAYELSGAEETISKYIVDGWKNDDIAEDRNVSVETVKTQVASILKKTNTGGRSELIRLALKVSPPIKSPK